MSPQKDSTHLQHVQENFVRHILPLRGFVYGLVPRRHLVDDIVQETFLTVCEKAEDFQPGTNFKAWIFAIARFKSLAALKRHSGEPLLLGTDIVNLLAAEERPDLTLEERVAALDRCVEKLGGAARRAMLLRYSENLGPTEIAQKMGWTVNALNVALSRARVAVRECVENTRRQQSPC